MSVVKVCSFVGLVAMLLLLGGALAISGPVLAGEQGEDPAARFPAGHPESAAPSPARPQEEPAAPGRQTS